jgi:hypothetical protein
MKAALRWMHPRFFHQQAFFSWSYPFSFQFPGRFYSEGLYDVAARSIWNRGAGGDEQTRPLFSQNIGPRMRQTGLVRRHRYLDAFHRKFVERYEDKILDCTSGELVNLVVQSTDPVYDSINECTWRRTYIENVSPNLPPGLLPVWKQEGLVPEQFHSIHGPSMAPSVNWIALCNDGPYRCGWHGEK